MKEYAASQDIPNFGVHVYFAISKDPIHNWEHINKAILPIGNYYYLWPELIKTLLVYFIVSVRTKTKLFTVN